MPTPAPPAAGAAVSLTGVIFAKPPHSEVSGLLRDDKGLRLVLARVADSEKENQRESQREGGKTQPSPTDKSVGVRCGRGTVHTETPSVLTTGK